MHGRKRNRFAVLGVLAVVAAMFASTTAAQADPAKTLLVTVTPPTATASTPTSFTVQVTNLTSPQLGAVEITVPFAIETSGVTTVVASGGKSWTAQWPVPGLTADKIRLAANSQTDRLAAGEFVSVVVLATPPNNTGGDTVYNWSAVGRQANTFNDAMGGNDVFQDFANRLGSVDRRNADGTTSSITLQTHQTLVTGTAVDCAQGPCRATLTEHQTVVNVSVACGAGTLVLDTTQINAFPGQEIGALAFYDFLGLDSACAEFSVVTVDFIYDKALVSSAGSLKFAVDYGGKYPVGFKVDPLGTEPGYVGDGNPLPACKQSTTVNCVASVKGGPGVVNAQLKLWLTDPVSGGFR